MTDGPPRYERVGVVTDPALVVDDGATVIVPHPEKEEWWVCRAAE